LIDFGGLDFAHDGRNDRRGDLVLDSEHISQLAIIAVGPKVTSGRSINEMHHSTLATSLNPNDADSLAHRSMVETFTGRPNQAINSLAAAMMMNPRPPIWYWAEQGLALYGLCRYAEAATAFERTTARPPSVQRYLTACYAQMDRIAEAQVAVAEALKMEPSSLCGCGKNSRPISFGRTSTTCSKASAERDCLNNSRLSALVRCWQIVLQKSVEDRV
jgi:tetratricopeptide (TPR) repeat protein